MTFLMRKHTKIALKPEWNQGIGIMTFNLLRILKVEINKNQFCISLTAFRILIISSSCF